MQDKTKLCLFLWTVIGIWSLAICVRASTNEPPMPPWSPTPDSVEGVELQRQIDELTEYAASLRPSPRVVMSDGRIITWSNEAVEWHVEAPLFKVEWRESLTIGEWETVGFRSGDKLTHNNAAGFYRVIKIVRPVSPPTHPPKRHPNPPQAGSPENTSTNTTYGGFSK